MDDSVNAVLIDVGIKLIPPELALKCSEVLVVPTHTSVGIGYKCDLQALGPLAVILANGFV